MMKGMDSATQVIFIRHRGRLHGNPGTPAHTRHLLSEAPVLSDHSPVSIPGQLAPSPTFPPIRDLSVTCLSLMDSILGSPLINEHAHRGPPPPPSPDLLLPFFSQESRRLLIQDQEHRFGDRNTLILLGFAPYTCMHAQLLQLCPTSCNHKDCNLPSSSVHGDSPGKNTGVGYHALLQGIFLTQESSPRLLCLLQW